MKRALVCGAGGFIGHHLVRRLKAEGYWVRGVDLKAPEWSPSPADEFNVDDLRDPDWARWALTNLDTVDEVYQLAADMGGMGFIEDHEIECLWNNVRINGNMLEAAAEAGVGRYFFASSVCVYPDMEHGQCALVERLAYPAEPHNEYGWEKLYSERLALAYAWNRGLDVRIGRFQNTYGSEGAWCGGREKAPAALCRKIAESDDDGVIDIWGSGTAVRGYTYIDDLIDGIRCLMASDCGDPTNIGTDEYATVNELARLIGQVAGKSATLRHVDRPVGVECRNFSKGRIKSLGWKPRWSLRAGIARTYLWVAARVEEARALAMDP